MGKERRRSSEMGRMVEEFEKSGLTRKEFCAQQDLSLSTLDYWRRERKAKPAMVRVKVAMAEPGPGFTLSLKNGRRIESSWQYSEAELARLIRVVENV